MLARKPAAKKDGFRAEAPAEAPAGAGEARLGARGAYTPR